MGIEARVRTGGLQGGKLCAPIEPRHRTAGSNFSRRKRWRWAAVGSISRSPLKSPCGRHGVLPLNLRREVVRCRVPSLHALWFHADEGVGHVACSVAASEMCAPCVGRPQQNRAQRRGRQAGKERAGTRPLGTRLGSTSSGPSQPTRAGWHASVAAHRRRAEALAVARDLRIQEEKWALRQG